MLLVRRNDRVAFMAGAYVFPGGRVDADDHLLDPQSAGESPHPAKGFPDLTQAEERAYRVAAIRELEEEAALLLARDDAGLVDQLAAERVRAAFRGTRRLTDVLPEEHLRLALDTLIPIAHWVTPEIETRRYDTRFFLTHAPNGQDARHDAGEMTELAWMEPAAALERCRAGAIMLPPPTWTILRQVSRHDTLPALFQWALSVQVVRIQPNFVKEGTTAMLILPGDRLYRTLPGWETPEETRFILEEGKGWRATSGG